MRTVFRFGLKDTWKRFQDDQSGIALIYVTVALPVLVGFSLLAIDVGRLSSLQSSLQHGADALALAGAGELDRRPDAIVRANRAIAELVTTNTSLFGTSVVTIDESQVSVRYLATIPGHGEGREPSRLVLIGIPTALDVPRRATYRPRSAFAELDFSEFRQGNCSLTGPFFPIS